MGAVKSEARAPVRIMLLYWGKRGAMPRFTLELARAALEEPGIATTVSVSRQNELFQEFAALGPALFPVETFGNPAGAALKAWRIPLLRRQLRDRIVADRIDAVIELMPHVWSSAVMGVIASTGCRYATIAHDADPHTGDATARVIRVLNRTFRTADRVLTLSEPVARRLAETGLAEKSKIRTLFHPDFSYSTSTKQPPEQGRPIRLLFLGRIMPYKGLGLFVDTVELLRREGIAVEAGVFGEGPLGEAAGRLANLGAEVVNRWLTDGEIADALARYHVMVLSHTEASQSGVAAAALGAGLPVISTPVGGLVEQVKDGETGLLARGVDAPSLAEAVKRLIGDPSLYRRMTEAIRSGREARSMRAFLHAAIAATLD